MTGSKVPSRAWWKVTKGNLLWVAARTISLFGDWRVSEQPE